MAWSLLLCVPKTSHRPPLPISYTGSRTNGLCSLNTMSSTSPRPWLVMRRRSTASILLGNPCKAQKRSSGVSEDGRPVRRAQQAALWAAEAAYILWLFLLPYAPGDPVWAIKSSTITDLVGLSLNFFFILPLLNFVGIHVIEAPVLHPMSEGLFNFVIGWTVLFAPLLFTDCRRDRYKGSLDLLWGFQMFLTNSMFHYKTPGPMYKWETMSYFFTYVIHLLMLFTDYFSFALEMNFLAFLIPYMAIRLNDMDLAHSTPKQTPLGSLMTGGAPVVAIVGGVVCLISIFWAFFGRSDEGFGGIADRWEFLGSYIGSERLAYAFIWDICLYAIFQPWLIGDNLQNVKKNTKGFVSNLRFFPVVGLVAYLLCINNEEEL